MTTPRTRELSLYDGQDCTGTIKIGIRGDAVVYDADGKRVGCFGSATAAASALKPALASKP